MALYLAALALGAVVGLALPQRAGAFEAAVTPVLVALLYATFLGVPMARLRAAFTDGRFMAAILVVNFLIAPLVVLVLLRPLADAPALLVGVLLVLLAPCVDYVMVFTRLAGGAWSRTLAASPVLMLLQILMLPLWLTALAGGAAISWRPFAWAFLLMILIPLGLSVLTRWAADRRRWAAGLQAGATALMVPLMMATLATVVASQVDAVSAHPGLLARVLPIYLLYALIMPAVGEGVGRLLGQGAASRLALAFSGTTRNSLVVLPLALALPRGLEPAAIVVVAQTLVELVVMVAYTRLLPRLIR
ncbi:arsenic resistance protein [Actinomyces capricornis]|uniref:Arsenic resistance protein n=1 Tax=Actinomyces capricornis TaxID=2755559 RepID=A0ABM7U8R9_9ACTO|nr:arsenic resistance protein [Actinomyces capricornis]